MMRIALLILISSTLYSQEFKKLRAGVGLGVGFNPGTGDSGMMLIYFEPSYHFTDQFTVGMRIQNTLGPQGKDIASFALTGQYYFSKKHFRPFAGIGASIYQDLVSEAGAASLPEKSFGLFPRLGFDVGHFNLIADFDVIGSKINANYLTIKMGVAIGGGRKKIK